MGRQNRALAKQERNRIGTGEETQIKNEKTAKKNNGTEFSAKANDQENQ
jgi:hypothetical protein